MKTWWKENVVYQIYPRSFQDSNGDGVGDIPGIISRLDELKDLGIGTIWLSPVYASPGADNGYDISDYRAINPEFGTMADMEELIAEAKERDIKIIMDLVINHTSDEHEWFKKSRAGDLEYRDYYIWQKGRPNGTPQGDKPNNWTGFFLTDAWEFDEERGEYYLHLFHEKQPDLNYRNPKVIEEVKGILQFWLDKGIAGFRCDVINIIYKTSLADGKWRPAIRGLEHYKSQEGNHEVLRQLRRDVLGKYDCFTVGETVMVDLAGAKELCDESRGELDMVFYFDHLEVDRRIFRYIPKKFKSKKLIDILTKWQQGLEWNAICLENHDQPRIVSHYGDEGEYWARSAKMLATMEFTLRGTTFVYQGQEIGMTNFDYTSLGQMDDVESHNIDKLMRKMGIPAKLRWYWIRTASRDNARTPMQWDDSKQAGFTTGTPWLAVNSNHKTINYKAEKQDNNSVLSYYKRMIAFRAAHEAIKYGTFTPLYTNENLVEYVRELDGEKYTVILNFSNKKVQRELKGKIVVSNVGRRGMDSALLPYEALVLRG